MPTNEEMNAALRRASGRTLEEIEEDEGDVDMNDVLRSARGIEVKDKEAS